MSMLACLGNDAEALRDILVHRLESQTEDISLKNAILKFFTCSVKSQPGLIQLLLSTDNEEGSCLKSVILLLKNLEHQAGDEEAGLHLQVIEFMYNLWSNSCAVAVGHLKKQDNFWTLLTWPLFGNHLGTKLNGYLLR